MEITITLNEQDQSLQAEILKVLLKGEEKETQPTPKPTKQPTPKPYPTAGKEKKEEAPLDTTSISDESDKTPTATEQPTPKPTEEPAETPSDAPDGSTEPTPEKPSEEPAGTSSAPSMEDLRKSVNAISRKKGLNWLYSWLGELGVKSIAEIPAERLEEANTKLQNYK